MWSYKTFNVTTLNAFIQKNRSQAHEKKSLAHEKKLSYIFPPHLDRVQGFSFNWQTYNSLNPLFCSYFTVNICHSWLVTTAIKIQNLKKNVATHLPIFHVSFNSHLL